MYVWLVDNYGGANRDITLQAGLTFRPRTSQLEIDLMRGHHGVLTVSSRSGFRLDENEGVAQTSIYLKA